MLFKKKEEKQQEGAGQTQPAASAAQQANAAEAKPITAKESYISPQKLIGRQGVSFLGKLRGLQGALRGPKPKLVQLEGFVVREPKRLIYINKDADPSNIDIRYPLLEPFAYARVSWNEKMKELVYNVQEPQLGKDDEETYSKIIKGLVEIVDVELSAIKNTEFAIKYVEEYMRKIISEYGLSVNRGQYLRLLYHVYRNFVGLNEIEPLMHDDYIEDIGCDGTGVPLYVVHKKFGSLRTNIVFSDLEKLRDFVVKLSERCNRYISYAEPLLDGTLPDGSRVQASLAGDVTTRGPTFSIRKFAEEPFSPIDMMENGTADAQMLAYLWLVVESGASILICGGVATGKTSFLNALSIFIPREAKIISIEDTRELQLPHENWIPSASRVGFGVSTADGKYGEVTMFDLLKESFRQNPDYVIVGEVRGAEAYVMFQGMAAGHPSIGTMHAGKVDDVIHRLETPPIELSPSLIETLDMIVLMVHAREVNKSARRVKEISEIESLDSTTGNANTNKVFAWMPSSDSFQFNESSVMFQKISKTKGTSIEQLKIEMERRKKLLEWMRKQGIRNYIRVAEVFSDYRKNPEKVLRQAGIS